MLLKLYVLINYRESLNIVNFVGIVLMENRKVKQSF